MIRGLYSAATGMTFQQDQVDAIANNLANVETSGYKRSEYIAKSFGDLVVEMAGGATPPASLPVGVKNDGLARFDTAGNVRSTGNPTNLALAGPGYFLVRQPDGKDILTRDGDFNLDATNRLVTKTGAQVLDATTRQPLVLDGPLNQITIRADGTASINGNDAGRVLVVQPTDAQLATRFPLAPPNLPAASSQAVTMRQGFLEQSNVNVVSEMVMLIEASKTFAMGQKVVSQQDQMLQKATNDLGRVQ